MDEKIKEIIVECIKLKSTDLSYVRIESIIKDVINYKIKNNIEYYIDESGLEGRNIEYNLIDISNKEFIREVIINKRKIDDRINDITTIKQYNEYNHQKNMFVFELLYELNLLYIQYNKFENLTFSLNYKFDTDKYETYIEKYSALQYTKEEMLDIIASANFKTSEMFDYIEQVNDCYNKYLNSEKEVHISILKKNLDNFYSKFKSKDESIDDFLYRIEKTVDIKISNIDSSRDGSESKAILYDSQLKEIIDYIKQEFQTDYINVDDVISVIEVEDEAQKVYDSLDKEINKILSASKKDFTSSREDLPLLVKQIIDERNEDIINLEKIDPEKSVYEYLIENYPDVVKVISSKMNPLQFYDKINNLPEEIDNYLKNEFLIEYKNFISDIKQIGAKKQEELEVELSNLEEKYTYGIYYKYIHMSEKEKEALITYSDAELCNNIVEILKQKRELAKINIHCNKYYATFFKYLLKREENLSQNNVEIVDRLNKNDNKCKEVYDKYFKSDDISKSLNSITNKDIETIYSSVNGIRTDFQKISDIIQKDYNKYIIKCGMTLLDLINFEDFEKVKDVLSLPTIVKIVEEFVGVGLYQLYSYKDKELNAVQSMYNEYKFSLDIITEILKYINLKYKLIEFNYKQQVASVNIKANIPNTLGLYNAILKIDKYNKKMIYANRDRSEILKSQILNYNKREDLIFSKLNSAQKKTGEFAFK